MGSAHTLAGCRIIEQMRGALRDAARLELSASMAAMAEAERSARTEAAALAAALGRWTEALDRRSPDPAIFNLAGAHVVRSDDRLKAAVLNQKIAQQVRNEALVDLARAEARLEGAQLVSQGAWHDHDRRRQDRAAREAEDAFVSRRRL